jgi:2-amino-4-hydroxy-6-hydroxymethyldihydropteridine diphosphokinase
MDLDILLYGDVVMDEPDLVIPHPRLARRRFVLAPLAAIGPAVRHPVLKLAAEELLRRLDPGTPIRHLGVLA